MELKRITRCVALACGSVAASASIAQQTQPAPAPTALQLERVTITGPNIRRTDQETVAPVTVISREQIGRSGQSTVADVLRNIPANTTGSYNESFTNSVATGSAGISLRGLGRKATRVLFNGRRVAGYGFAQNLQDSFLDLNSIPSSAVERIEVLRDGASAIYGSDALAGVVNVTLRRDFKVIEVAARAGVSSEGDADEQRASIAGGFGDLCPQKFNVFAMGLKNTL